MHSSKVRIGILLPKEFPAPGTLPKNAKVMFILSSCSPEQPVAPHISGCQEKQENEKLSLKEKPARPRSLALLFLFSFSFLSFLPHFFHSSSKVRKIRLVKSLFKRGKKPFSFIDCRYAWLEFGLGKQPKEKKKTLRKWRRKSSMLQTHSNGNPPC